MSGVANQRMTIACSTTLVDLNKLEKTWIHSSYIKITKLAIAKNVLKRLKGPQVTNFSFWVIGKKLTFLYKLMC